MIWSSLMPSLVISLMRAAAIVAVTPHSAIRPAPEKRATLAVLCALRISRMMMGRSEAASATQAPTLAPALSRAAIIVSMSSP